jgi:hypothetical protein
MTFTPHCLTDQQAESICGGGTQIATVEIYQSATNTIASQVNNKVRQNAVANGSYSNNFTNNYKSFNGSGNLYNVGG